MLSVGEGYYYEGWGRRVDLVFLSRPFVFTAFPFHSLRSCVNCALDHLTLIYRTEIRYTVMGQETNGVNGNSKGDNEKKPTPENVTMFQGFEWNVRTRDFNRIARYSAHRI